MKPYFHFLPILLMIMVIGLGFSGCDLIGGDGTDGDDGAADAADVDDMTAFRETYMRTFDLEYEESLAARALRPVLMGASAGVNGSRATVPVSTAGEFADGSVADYPEPGMTTAYTVAAAGFGTDIYRIVSTTAYPESDDVAETYVEEYYVQDLEPLASWGTEDLIVDDAGTADPAYRVRMELTFDDGSVRSEKIVKLIRPWEEGSEAGFAPFDIEGTLTFPEFAYPESDTEAQFSSVVVYTQDIAESREYWFWEGSISGGILGVRYYTEHYSADGGYYLGTVAAYERTIETFSTLSADSALTDQLSDLFLDQDHTALAESVLRKEVAFEVTDGVVGTTAVGMNTVMRTHVVDALAAGTESDDFLLQLLNDDEAVFDDWDGAAYHIPSGPTADEIIDDAADPDEADVLTQTEVTNPDGDTLPLIVSIDYSAGDLTSLYKAIEDGVITVVVDTGDDITDSDLPVTPAGESQTLLMADVGVAEFDGDIGYEVTDPAADDPALNPTSVGTVEAWVWVDAHADTAGIVHKGAEIDFSDEGYSLQFWGKHGNVVFAIVEQSPSYKYSLAKSNLRLNTGKWYYLVGRWDADKVYLDIWYDNASGATQRKSYSKNNTLSSKEPYPDSGPLVIGSQFLSISDDRRADGYYGFDGRINGVVVSTWRKDDADLSAFYEAQKAKTSLWE